MQQNNHAVYTLSLLLAPLLMLISGFFWVNGEYGVAGGTILFLSTPFWILSLVYLYRLIQSKIAQWALLFSIVGFISGAMFGFLGVMAEIFGISHQSYIDEFEKHPIATGILLFWSGPLTPLGLMLLGILFLRTKASAKWVAIMFILGGLTFPAGRISRNEWLAHGTDIFLLVPMWYMAFQAFADKK